jgi:hypothetical protein
LAAAIDAGFQGPVDATVLVLPACLWDAQERITGIPIRTSQIINALNAVPIEANADAALRAL